MKSHRSKPIKTLLQHRLFLGVNAVLFCFLAMSFGREYLRNRQIQATILDLETRARSLEARNVEIATINAQLESEAFLEQEARLRLGLVKPGERVVVVSDDDGAGRTSIGGEAISAPLTEGLPTTVPGRWFAYFFDTQTFDRLVLLERPRL